MEHWVSKDECGDGRTTDDGRRTSWKMEVLLGSALHDDKAMARCDRRVIRDKVLFRNTEAPIHYRYTNREPCEQPFELLGANLTSKGIPHHI